ncbi:GtrA family protein [Phaeobacter sp. B1627]|nr:GtrA family protein [Phaeobacter sp. B1627]
MRTDRDQILRFCVVGTGVAGLYLGLFLLGVELGLAEAAANIISLGCAVVVQYIAQTAWTFRRPLAVPEQILRFACTIGLGFVVSTLITAHVGPHLGWPPALSGAVVMLWLPIQNYVMFRIWVFAAAAK